MKKQEINKYDNLFDDIEILLDETPTHLAYWFDSVHETKTYYTATFHDKFAPGYEGFYYDGCNVEPFKNVATSDQGKQYQYDCIDEIINLIPEAKKYHEEITDIVIERYIQLIDEDGTVLFFIKAGLRMIEVE